MSKEETITSVALLGDSINDRAELVATARGVEFRLIQAVATNNEHRVLVREVPWSDLAAIRARLTT